jgi:glutamyl-tRNA reductase
MNLLCVGINHTTAPIEIREKLWFSAEEIHALLPVLRERFATECVLTSTCNRTELYLHPSGPTADTDLIWKFLAERKNASNGVTGEHFYVAAERNAVEHLFSVASGIDSMVIGDIQILNQLKEAYALAQESGTTGTIFNKLFSHALHVGKRARTETEISEGAVSISYAAAELASKIFDDLGKRAALLIGAGETGKLTAKHLTGRNLGKLLLANRTRSKAEEIAAQLHGSVVEYENFRDRIHDVDIIITAVDAPSYIITAADLKPAMKERGNRPLFIIDIGLPRNVDPAANTIDNIFLHDIDALNHIIDNNVAHRRAQIKRVGEIVAQEAEAFIGWTESLQLTPTIQQLRDQFEAIRQSEVDRLRHGFPPEKQEEIEMLTKRIVNKILHAPLVNLRNGSGDHSKEETHRKISVIRHLFGLDKGKT